MLQLKRFNSTNFECNFFIFAILIRNYYSLKNYYYSLEIMRKIRANESSSFRNAQKSKLCTNFAIASAEINVASPGASTTNKRN